MFRPIQPGALRAGNTAVRAAWQEIKTCESPDRLKGEMPFTYTRRSDIDGALYIGFESVWCEPQESAPC